MTGVSSQPPRGPLRERQLAFRESEIVRTASEVLADTGCRDFTMDEIARRLGISKATLYGHFRSREQLIGRALEQKLEGCLGKLADATAEGRDGFVGGVRRLVLDAMAPSAMQSLSVPCCLRELECPYAPWAAVSRYLHDHDARDDERLVPLADVARVLAAIAVGRIRRSGRAPGEDDAEEVLDLLLKSIDA